MQYNDLTSLINYGGFSEFLQQKSTINILWESMDEEIFYVNENVVEMGYKKFANWSVCIGLTYWLLADFKF